MPITNYPNGLSSFGNIVAGEMGVGNVYYVWLTSKTAIMADMLKKYGTEVYPDGERILYQDAGTGDGIAAAIAACKGGRNDYVIIGTGTYALTTAISLAGKSSVHLIGVNGDGMDVGTPGAVILRQDGNYTTITDNAFCEIAGLQIENKLGYSAINVPAGIGWTNIHNNLFKWSGAAGIDCVNYGSGASWGTIHHNKFVQWAGTGGRACIYIGNAATTGVTVSNNDILAFGDGLVWDYGILHTGLGGLVKDNCISESGGTDAASGATITVGIEIGVATAAVGNRIAVAAGQALSGGTAAHSFVDNMDGATGAGNGSASNLET